MIVIGIDPSLRGSGFGIIESEATSTRVLDFGTIKNPPKLTFPACLLEIEQRVTELIARHHPTEMAIENTIYVQSYATAIKLGAARAASIIPAARAGLQVFEYAPKRVKQAVVGRGGAGKHQVGFMIRSMLGLSSTPSPDAADALALALTHIQSARFRAVRASRDD